MMLGILGHIVDDDEARSIVRRLLEALAPGGYLTVCDGTNIISEAGVEAQRLYNESGAVPYRLRSPDQIAELFEGLELVEPAAPPPRWTSSPAWPASPEQGAPGDAATGRGMSLADVQGCA
jgi:S-adenosyl methyltransferase